MNILQEIIVPRDSVNDEFVFIAKMYVQDNEFVEVGHALLDIETSKTVLTIQSEQSGYVEILCNEGDDVSVGELLIRISDTLHQDKLVDIKADNILITDAIKITPSILFSKKAQTLVDKHMLPYETFSYFDYVTESDVLEAISSMANNGNNKIDNILIASNFEMNKISNQKRREIEYLHDVQSSSLTSSVSIYVNMATSILNKHSKNKLFSQSVLPIIIYETSRLLVKYKMFNAYFDNDFIRFYKDINIGVAVDIDDGLKVLTLYNSHKTGMDSIEEALLALFDRYLEKKLTVQDVSQSTFTISDLSTNGVDLFVPLINSKQSAILGISKIDEKLDRFFLTLVFDHRITEGRTASIFLSELKERIESYEATIHQDSPTPSNISCSKCLKSHEEERSLNGVGMIKIINDSGVDDHICIVCLLGH